jgi:hypothetical protein
MKPGGIKRIIKEDFPAEIQKWIDTLLYPLNQNIEQTKLILDKNLTFEDNILASIRTLTLDGTSLLIADSTADSNVLTNPSYYQATIDGTVYGIQPNLKVDGEGVLPDTLIAIVGTNITLSLPVQYTQTKGEFVVGGSFPFKFAHGLTVRPSVVMVAKIEDTAILKAPLTRGVFVQWDLSGDSIVIKALTGLQAGKRYKVTFLIF